MRAALVLSREIQVDIRLLVTLKAEEGFKWNIEAVLFKRFPADRAIFIRHVTASHTCKFPDLLGIKIKIMTIGAVIMRAERVYFRDTRHCGHQRGAYGSPGTYQIAVLI